MTPRSGQDTLVEPNVWFGPGVKIAAGVTIHAFSHIDGRFGRHRRERRPVCASQARRRPRTRGPRSAISVEVKKATIEKGAKVSHLTYIGDARVGADANIGAGTITCNYDGYTKHFTDIGAGAFIGSNSSLVAPVKLGDGANIGVGQRHHRGRRGRRALRPRPPEDHPRKGPGAARAFRFCGGGKKKPLTFITRLAAFSRPG